MVARPDGVPVAFHTGMPTSQTIAERRPALPGVELPARPPEVRSAPRRLLGEILVDEGLITQGQLDEALWVQAEQSPQIPIGQILVEQGAIRREQLDAVLDKHRLGDLLVTMNAITREQPRARSPRG